MLDLQTCKIIDIVVEKTTMTPWLCHGLSYDNQIWCRDSFQKAWMSAKFHCSSSTIIFRRWGGEHPLLPSHRKPKEAS